MKCFILWGKLNQSSSLDAFVSPKESPPKRHRKNTGSTPTGQISYKDGLVISTEAPDALFSITLLSAINNQRNHTGLLSIAVGSTTYLQGKRKIKRPKVSWNYITNILSVYSQESSERAHIRSLSGRLSLLYIPSLSSLIPNRSSTKWGAV